MYPAWRVRVFYLNPTTSTAEQFVFQRNLCSGEGAVVVDHIANTTFYAVILSDNHIIELHVGGDIWFGPHQVSVKEYVHVATVVVNDYMIPFL